MRNVPTSLSNYVSWGSEFAWLAWSNGYHKTSPISNNHFKAETIRLFTCAAQLPQSSNHTKPLIDDWVFTQGLR